MKKPMIRFGTGLAAGFLAVAALSGYGAGYDMPDLDAFAVGRGMAVVATADNPSAIYYNPAGITQLQGHNFRGGIYGVDLEPTFTATTGPNSGTTYHNHDKYHAVPQFYYTYNKDKSPWSFGLGLYSPFGLGQEWPDDTGFRTVGTAASLTCIALNPVIAYKLTPTLSIGAGASLLFATASLRQGLFNPFAATDGLRFDGDGWGVGYNVGILWQPHPKISIGGTFRSSSTITMRGHTKDYIGAFSERTSARADFPLPLKFIVGISYRPTPEWNFEFDADYKDWSSVRTLTIEQTQPTVLGQNLPVVFNWESSWYYEFGVTRYLKNGWLVSAGYIFNENSVPDAHFIVQQADMDRHFFSVGVGHRGKRYDFDIAYQFGYGPTRTVTGSAPSIIGQTGNGKYDYISHAVAISVGMHF